MERARLRTSVPLRTAPAGKDKADLLSVSGLNLALGEISLIRDISFTVSPGETIGLVGESGSGKTLTALALMGLLPPGIAVTGGRVDFAERDGTAAELLSMDDARLRHLRGNEIGMIFQDPSGSLDPVQRVGAQVAEAILVHRSIGRAEAAEQTLRLLEQVGLPDPPRVARAFPHELSGGQKQRAMIAGAIANEPGLLIADEPTTALDVTIQAQILDLLEARKRRSGRMGMIFITHNLAVVARIADRVCVMYAGEIVEEGPVPIVFGTPRHPYTAALLASVPEDDTSRLRAIEGTVPQPAHFPRGCRFAPRCGLMTRECQAAVPPLRSVGEGHRSRCLHADAMT
jgi:peptide/nickel transport system permease protein